MLSEETKKEVQELTSILLRLDSTARTIMLSNATTLLARQEIALKNDNSPGELKGA